MSKLLSIFIALVAAFSSSAADGNWLMGTNIPQPGSDWQFYNGVDAPEGAWRCITDANTNCPVGLVTNSFTIQAGTNYFLFKGNSYNGTGTHGDSNLLWVIVGNVSNSIPVGDISGLHRHWSQKCELNVTNPTNVFAIKVQPLSLVAIETKYIWRGFYTSTNIWEDLYEEAGSAFDYILNYQYPTNIDTSAATKGNKVENGGFEVGINHGWGLFPLSGGRDYSLESMWDTNVFHDGVASFHMATDSLIRNGSFSSAVYQAELQSKPFKLSTNKQYTISIWSKETVSSASNGNGTLTIRNPITVPTGLGYSNEWSASTTIISDTNWHRTSITTNFICYPTDDFQISIRESTNSWIDSIQVEEGSLTGYQETRAVELGIVSTNIGNIFLSTDTVSLPLYAYSTNNAIVTNLWQVYDWRNSMVATGVVSMNLTANNLASTNILPGIGLNGVFRLLVWSDHQPNSTEECMFTVVPVIASSKTNLFANTTASPAQYEMNPLFNSGMRMTRAMSAFQAFNFAKTGTTPLFFDTDVGKFTNSGIQILATLYNDNNLPDYSTWPAYVSNMVAHYKNRVHYWEVMNEPLYIMNESAYTNVLITTATNIRSGDPTAIIVGLGGVHDSVWSSNVFALLGTGWTNYMDIASTHMYPYVTSPTEFAGNDEKASGYKQALSAWNPTIWNTEAGAFDQGAQEYNANFIMTGTALWSNLDSDRFQNGLKFYPELVVKNAIICFGWGQKKIFNYDDRVVGGYPAYYKGHTTGWDYDDSRKPKMVMLSALNSMIGEATGIGKLTNGAASIYEFINGSDTWLAMWSSNSLPMTVTWTNTALAAFDVMGNSLTMTNHVAGSSTLYFERTPVYVKGTGINSSTISNITVTALVTNLTDTMSPSLSIDVAPRTIYYGAPFQFRWQAFDDTSVPSISDPFVILYSTKYDSDSWSEWSAYNTRTISSITTNQHTFSVAVMDAAGNATTNTITFNTGPSLPSNNSQFNVSGSLTVGSLNLGQ